MRNKKKLITSLLVIIIAGIFYLFEGYPIEVEIDGIKDGRLVINELYVGEAGETASLNDIEEMSACIIADYMVSMQKQTKNKSL